jgi:hypothetical protein
MQGSRKKMLIGRSDDPHNPCRVAAVKVSHPFGRGSRNPSGPAAPAAQTGRTHDRNRTASEFFLPTPCTNGAVHTRSYYSQILRLAYLAPDITTAILEGRQPSGLTATMLVEHPLPLSWQAQRAVLGFAWSPHNLITATARRGRSRFSSPKSRNRHV